MHTLVSPLERLASMETGIKNLDKKVEDGFKAINTKVDDFINGADKKYAPKWIGNAFMICCGAILMGVIGIIFIEPLKNKSPQQTVTITTQQPDGSFDSQKVPTGSSVVITPQSPTATPAQPSSSTTITQPATGSDQKQDQPKTGFCAIPLIGNVCG